MIANLRIEGKASFYGLGLPPGQTD
jgi:hypothetical protein